jgi:hypothetical protein
VHLVQLLLPVYDDRGEKFPDGLFADVRRELTERYGGVTAYMRAPATGLWKRGEGTVDRDQMVMVEVMVNDLDHRWWADYRRHLERTFHQDVVLVRAIETRQL